MREALLVGGQVLMIYIYIAIGIFCIKKKIVTPESGKNFSSFLLTIITPCLMIDCYLRPMQAEHLKGLGLAFLFSIIFHVIAIVGSCLLIRKREDEKYKIERLAAIYSNCGFMALPLIEVAVGETGLFYGVAFISVFNILIWSNGIQIITGKKGFSVKKIFLNPGFLGFAAGILLYFTQIPVPDLLKQTISSLADMNTPLAMISTGIFLANVDIKSSLTDKHIYWASFLRLILFPLFTLCLMKVLGVHNWMSGADQVAMTVIIGSSCGAAASVTLFPAKFGMNGEYGAQIIALSTLFSVITIPLLTVLTKLWIG